MQSDITSWDDIVRQITEAPDEEVLAKMELRLFGRKQGAVTVEMKLLQSLPENERKERGAELNQIKKRLQNAIRDRRSALAGGEAQIEKEHIDATLELPDRVQTGHAHLIPQFIRTVEEVFGRMGFDVAEGPEIESEEYNFSKLNIPETHPARDMQDTFFIAGREHSVLRTHTSPVQIRYMEAHTPPFRMICPGPVYRKDADATHSPMFHQFEGLMVAEDVSLAAMKAVMIEAMQALIGEDLEFRFRTSYFPFVEPGLEVDMRQKSAGKNGRWLEVVGCGMVHPAVLEAGNIDPQRYRGFAFGFGVERLLMIKYGIEDLRAFFENDIRFLQQW